MRKPRIIDGHFPNSHNSSPSAGISSSSFQSESFLAERYEPRPSSSLVELDASDLLPLTRGTSSDADHRGSSPFSVGNCLLLVLWVTVEIVAIQL